MTATPAQVADEVLAAVNALELSEPFTASRSFWPDRKPGELLSLTLTVLPRAVDRSADTRVSQRIDHLALYALKAGTTGFVCVGVTIDPMVSATHMQEHGVFTGVVTARLRALR